MLRELELDIISDVVSELSISTNAPTKKVTADSTNNNAIDLTNDDKDKAIDLNNEKEALTAW